MVNLACKRIRPDLPIQTYLDEVSRRLSWQWGRVAFGLLALGLVALVLDIKSATRIHPDRVTLSPYLSIRTLTYRRDDVTAVRTACTQSRGSRGGLSNTIRYTLTVTDGRQIDIPRNLRVFDGTLIDLLDLVDGAMRQRGVPHSPEEDQTRGSGATTPYNPRCLAYYRNTLSPEDFVRLRRIFRLE